MKLFQVILSALIIMTTTSACSADTPQSVDMIVEGDYLVTMDAEGTIIQDGAIAVKNGEILATGTRQDIHAQYTSENVIPGTNRVLMPGLINGHTHTAMTLFRGMADDYDLMTWLTNYIFPMEGRFVDPEFVKIGTELACLEMIRGGTTTFVDMYFYPEVIADVTERCGMRAIIGAPAIDFPSPGFNGWDDSYAAAIEFVTNYQSASGRITAGFAPHAPYTVTPEHYAALAAKAKELGAPITTHIAEDQAEVKTIKERYGTTSIDLLNKQGAFDVTMIGAHIVWPTDEDMDILKEKGVGPIHNPTSNMKTAAGFSPVQEMISKGIDVGLGTDGAASNNDLDMWEEIRMAALIHKGFNADATVMPAETVLQTATSMGARAIDMGGQIGSLEAGKRADMIQISLDAPRLTPLYNVLSHLVYVADSEDVVTTIIDGQVVMLDSEVLTLDAEAVKAAAVAKSDEIKAALAQGPSD
ncbi:MAG: amidohydrolase [Alphaproteobacteria bacterium]|nr:MAG: amidohydrolase [Alphaproteobacteria bacterium]